MMCAVLQGIVENQRPNGSRIHISKFVHWQCRHNGGKKELALCWYQFDATDHVICLCLSILNFLLLHNKGLKPRYSGAAG